MEDLEFSFDAGSILSDEEANKLFEETETQQPEKQEPEEPEEEIPAEEEEETQPSEEVGKEEPDENGKDTIDQTDDGTSPNVYSSIANALMEDGVFSDFDKETINNVKSAEDFVELIHKMAENEADERTKRVDSALRNGVAPDTVRMYEQTLQYLASINEEVLSAEGEEGENLRKQIIYNDLINRGYSQERANREIEKSFKAGSDIEDAKDALEALNKFYKDGYAKVQQEAKEKTEAYKKAQQEQSDKFKKMLLEDEVSLGDTKLDKKTCQRVFDAVSKPVYKDPQSGRLLTSVQKFQQENPLEFLKQLGIWFVLTDGGKNLSGLLRKEVQTEKNKAVKELARKINSSSLNPDGSLKYVGGSGNGDPLLDDGWKIGWGSNTEQ